MINKIGYGCIIIMAGNVLISCNHPVQQQASKAIPVNVFVVHKEAAEYFDNYPGTVTALNTVELRADVSGYITGIFFQDGQYVERGQKLYEIDRQQYQAAYEQAQADLKVSEANLQEAQQDADRYEELNKKDAIAKQTLDHALSGLQSAKSQVAASQANVTRVATDLKYSQIYAPFSGTIGISQVKMGSLVSPGQTLLNTISSDDPIGVDFQIDETEIGRYTDLLQHAAANQVDSTFTIILPDGSVYPYPGKIALIDRAVDPETGTIRVRLLFPNKNNELKDGLNCEVRVENKSVGGAMLIPQEAMTEQMGEYFVYLVHADTVAQQKIEIGNNIKNMIIVKNGLELGDTIVTAGIQKLREGSAVQIGIMTGSGNNKP
jgi:RND family efflux transporter MFP subunit